MKTANRRALRFMHIFSLMAATTLLFAACSDDPHDPSDPTEDNGLTSYTAQGEMFSLIPAMPVFEGSTSTINATITWENEEATLATIKTETFSVTIPQMDRDIVIGAMEITGVSAVKDQDGNYALSKEKFEVQAGEYFTTGSLSGNYDPALKDFNFTLLYYPGSMPFEVKSVFTAN